MEIMTRNVELASKFDYGMVNGDRCYLCRFLLRSHELAALDPDDLILTEPYSDFCKNASQGCFGCRLLVKSIDCLVPFESQRYGMIQISREVVSDLLRFVWISALNEQGEPSLEMGMAWRTYLGFEICRTSVYPEAFPWMPSAKSIPGDTESEEGLATVRSWLSQCTSDHIPCGLAAPKELPSRILDLGDRAELEDDVFLCDRLGKLGLYVCLSHCWGNTENMVKTTSSTLQSHQHGIPVARLPKTFRDAVCFVRRLGLRWLWIDSLCIVQDSISDWYGQTSKMAEVYSGAYLTVAASMSADGNGGLFSKAGSDYRPRSFELTEITGESHKFLVRYTLPHCRSWDPLRTKLPLFTRGWTFQERLLSTRVLHFTPNELIWECKERYACECSDDVVAAALPDQASSNYTFQTIRLSIHNQLPKSLFWMTINSDGEKFPRPQWVALINRFSGLDLTFGDDKLPAFSGIARVMQERYDDVYLAGMWRKQLPNTLCWHGNRASDVRGLQASLRSPSWRAPTWSWASMDGPIHFARGAYGGGNKLAAVVEARCKQVGSDLTGRVQSGFLLVVGQLVPLRPPEPHSLIHDKGEMPQFSEIFQSDNDEVDKEELLRFGSLYLFPVIKEPNSVGWNNCLVLKETPISYNDVPDLDGDKLRLQQQDWPHHVLQPKVFERVGFHQLNEVRDCDISPFLPRSFESKKALFVIV